jgi:uncharacterized protein YwqG
LRWKHAPLLDDAASHRPVRYQLLGKGTMVQYAPWELRESHVLLMQFDTDYGMDWMWGDYGVLQYWITPEDLAARRFDRVHLTLEGG